MGALDNLREQRRLGGGVADSLTPTPDAKPDPAQHQWADPTDIPGQFSEIGTMLKNVPSSAGHVAKDIGKAVYNWRDTGENIVNLGKGALQLIRDELGTESLGHEYEQYPEAFGHYLKERYGSGDAIKQTMMDDPVGFLLDASTAFSGAGALAKGGETLATAANAAKTADVLGTVGDVASQAGKVTSPLRAAGEAASAAKSAIGKPVGAVTSHVVGGLGTGTGAEPLQIAYQAGKEGGAVGQNFLGHMRKTVPTTEAVDDARTAVDIMRKQRGAAYQEAMRGIKGSNIQLNFNDVNAAVKDAVKMSSYGGVPRARLAPIAEKLNDEVEGWRVMSADPKVGRMFTSPEGFDQLKQRIWDIAKEAKDGTPESKMAMNVYHAVRDTIAKQSPEYAQIMSGYEEASDLLRQMEKTLSINPTAQIDTTLRKLQSVLRDNVNTSYAHRRELAEFLANNGAPHLLEKIAGQSLSSWAPRGIGRATMSLEAAIALLAGGPYSLLKILPVLGMSIPRAMGETAYGLGAASRGLNKLSLPLDAAGKGAYQAGRLDEVETDSLTDQVRH
jgi:hypothetical protein